MSILFNIINAQNHKNALFPPKHPQICENVHPWSRGAVMRLGRVGGELWSWVLVITHYTAQHRVFYTNYVSTFHILHN